MTTDAATLSIFNNLFASVAEEMGVTLERTAYSPNIKERLDFSCAVFLGDGRMLAQAAHIPVHLGAMPASVRRPSPLRPFAPGDVVILNDPYQGGNHLPDITLVSPVFVAGEGPAPDFFVASRAHHADVGGISPGSMPLSRELFQEGIIIPPIKLVDGRPAQRRRLAADPAQCAHAGGAGRGPGGADCRPRDGRPAAAGNRQTVRHAERDGRRARR